jgi:predicted  nucleic acid-binding Zn-ribbon protein
MDQDRQFEIMTKLATLESDMENMERWQERQEERLDRLDEQIDTKTTRLEEKIDKIIENERQLLETFNATDNSLEQRLDSKYNKLLYWIIGALGTGGLGFLMYILQTFVSKH